MSNSDDIYATINKYVDSGGWGELIQDLATVAKQRGDHLLAGKLLALSNDSSWYSDIKTGASMKVTDEEIEQAIVEAEKEA